MALDITIPIPLNLFNQKAMLEDIDRAQTIKDIDDTMAKKGRLDLYTDTPTYTLGGPNMGSFGEYIDIPVPMGENLGMSRGDIAKKKQIDNQKGGGYDPSLDTETLQDKLGIGELYDESMSTAMSPADLAALQAMRSDDAYKMADEDELYEGLDIELKKKPEPKKLEEEDDRPKTLKDYMAKILDDGDALIALGGAIARGEGLVGGLEQFAKTRKETEATKYAREVAKYERERQQELDTLEKASTLAEIAYKESQLTSDEQKIAQDLAIQKARAQGITDIESAEFAEIYADAIESVVNKEKPLSLADISEAQAFQALGIDTAGMNLNSGTSVPLFDATGKRIN